MVAQPQLRLDALEITEMNTMCTSCIHTRSFFTVNKVKWDAWMKYTSSKFFFWQWQERRGRQPHSGAARESSRTLWTVQSPFGLFLPQLIVPTPHHHLHPLHIHTLFPTFGCPPRAVIASTVSLLLYLRTYPEPSGDLRTKRRAAGRRGATNCQIKTTTIHFAFLTFAKSFTFSISAALKS